MVSVIPFLGLLCESSRIAFLNLTRVDTLFQQQGYRNSTTFSSKSETYLTATLSEVKTEEAKDEQVVNFS